MTTNTGKQAAAAAKTLLAERIALVETLGAALDNHRRAEQAAATAAQHARDAYDTAKTGGWTAAELTKAGLRAPAAARTRTTKTTATPHNTTASDTPTNATDDATSAA